MMINEMGPQHGLLMVTKFILRECTDLLHLQILNDENF